MGACSILVCEHQIILFGGTIFLRGSMRYQDLLEQLQRLTPKQREQCVMVKLYAQVEPHYVDDLRQCTVSLPEARGQIVLFVP